MEESKKIWDVLLLGISNNISTVSYDMWFKNLEPLTIAYNKLILVANLKSAKNTINKNYRNIILDEIKKLNTYVDDYLIITPEEIPVYQTKIEYEKKEENSNYSSIFDPNFTFDKFVVGSSNQIAYAAAILSSFTEA